MQMATRNQNISFLGKKKKPLKVLSEQVKLSDGKAGKHLICSSHSMNLVSLW